MQRCHWVNLNNPLYVAYHDQEWSRPEHEDRMLFELLVLESFQAGLSWETVLNKRSSFRQAFDDFDVCRVSQYDEEKIAELLANPGIIRNQRKIRAAIRNAQAFLQIQEEYGSFDQYIWGFTNGETIREPYTLRTLSPLSDTIAADLKKRGMTFLGSTIVYAYLQAIGVLAAHSAACDFGQQ